MQSQPLGFGCSYIHITQTSYVATYVYIIAIILLSLSDNIFCVKIFALIRYVLHKFYYLLSIMDSSCTEVSAGQTVSIVLCNMYVTVLSLRDLYTYILNSNVDM